MISTTAGPCTNPAFVCGAAHILAATSSMAWCFDLLRMSADLLAVRAMMFTQSKAYITVYASAGKV